MDQYTAWANRFHKYPGFSLSVEGHRECDKRSCVTGFIA